MPNDELAYLKKIELPVKHCRMQRSFVALQKRWAIMVLIIKTAEIYDEHCRLTEGTNIDISGLSYDILKEKRVCNGLIQRTTNRTWNTTIIY